MGDEKNMDLSDSQNVYDDETFFEGYRKLRENPNSANILEEKPAIFSLCPDLKGKAVLDLGCGYGENCVAFSEMGAVSVVGIDISAKMLEVANTENKLDNIRYINMDMKKIDSIKGKFDVVFSSLAVHYIKDFRELLHNISNFLNQNGILIFSQEHPLTTAPIGGAHWTKDEEGNVLHYDLTDYRRNGERTVSWIIDGITKYHRCFSEIVNSLVDAGFIVERMLEPIPTKEVIDKLPDYEKGIHKPNFLIIKARKL